MATTLGGFVNAKTIHPIRNNLISLVLATSVICLFGMSCSSLQSDRMLSLTDDSLEAELTELTLAIVPLDRDPKPESIQKARILITELESKKIEDTVFRARLAAWSGRLSLIEGFKKNAEKSLKNANNLVSYDPAVTVLASRIETIPERRLDILQKGRNFTDDTPIIDIEKGLVLCELGRWSEAVAAFDTAFARLPPVFRETYKEKRENAWNLRSVGSQITIKTTEIAAKEAILWKDALTMVQSETTLFSFITGDAVWPIEKIANSLFEKQLVPQKEFNIYFLDTTLSRSDAAFFLWHIHSVWQGNPTLLTRYSSRYKSQKTQLSPIPDIALSDVFFDSVLGCIEWEFMTLPDGKNFKPNDTIKGVSFLRMIQKTEAAGRATN